MATITCYATFVPLLYAAGLTEADVRTILVENPRRVLTF